MPSEHHRGRDLAIAARDEISCGRPCRRTGVTVLHKLDVHPHHAQVALVDATWQDYPQWETGDEHVVFRAASLTDPDNPPYPGFAVATQPDIGPDGPVRSGLRSGQTASQQGCAASTRAFSAWAATAYQSATTRAA